MTKLSLRYREPLMRELLRRKARNAAYSMRAFARDLNISLTALSEFLAHKRALSKKNVQSIVEKLKWEPIFISNPSLREPDSNNISLNHENRKTLITINSYQFQELANLFSLDEMKLSFRGKKGKFEPSAPFERFGFPSFKFDLPTGYLKTKIRRLVSKNTAWKLNPGAIEISFHFEEEGGEIHSPFGFRFDVKKFILKTNLHFSENVESEKFIFPMETETNANVTSSNRVSDLVVGIAQKEFNELAASIFSNQIERVFNLPESQICIERMLLTWACLSTGTQWPHLKRGSVKIKEGKIEYIVFA